MRFLLPILSLILFAVTVGLVSYILPFDPDLEFLGAVVAGFIFGWFVTGPLLSWAIEE